MLPERPIAGWCMPSRARVAHYFDRMALYSQCGYYERDERGRDAASDEPRCKACRVGMGIKP